VVSKGLPRPREINQKYLKMIGLEIEKDDGLRAEAEKLILEELHQMVL